MSQLPHLLPPFNRLKDCRHGRMLFNINDQFIGRSLDLYGEFSEAEVELFAQLLRPGDVVVEVGSNIGVHTVPLARITGSGGVVMAFEPQRLVYQTLCANVALNDLVNVHAIHAAVGDTLGSVPIPVLNPTLPQNFGKFTVAGRTAGEQVALMTLDALNLQSCRLIKADCEGMETEVLRGAAQTIARFQPALYVENDRVERTAELTQLIRSFGYDMFRHEAYMFNPRNFFKNPENVFRTIASMNLLCVPAGVSQYISGLPKYDPDSTGGAGR